MSLRSALVVLLALALGACGSSPVVRHYTLQRPDLSAAAGTVPPPAAGLAVDVVAVRVPAQVDVPELVLRQGSGELLLAGNERWIAPLPDELREALSRELARLGLQDRHGLPQAQGEAVHRVRVQVRRFDAEWSRRTVLEAAWSSELAGKPGPGCAFRQVERVESGYEPLVRGHQRAIEALAAQIATALGSGRCPG